MKKKKKKICIMAHFYSVYPTNSLRKSIPRHVDTTLVHVKKKKKKKKI
jgi:hypothetical protein